MRPIRARPGRASLPLMAPFYEEVCQGAWVREAFEGAPALVGVNVVRPVGRSALTPPARRRGVPAVPARGVPGGHGPGVASRVRVREVAGPKSRRPGSGRPRWILESSPSALPGLLSPLLVPGWRRRRRAGGRRRRTGAGAGSAWLPSGSSRRRACAGSRPGRGCRCAAGDAGHVQHVVQPAVPGAGQAVADVLAAGRHRSARCRPGRQSGCGQGTGPRLPQRPGPGRRRQGRSRGCPSSAIRWPGPRPSARPS